MRPDKRETKPDRSEKGHRDDRRSGTMNGCKFYENMRMQCDAECNAQINNTANTQNMEGFWSVGLGSLQLSSTYKRSRPEI